MKKSQMLRVIRRNMRIIDGYYVGGVLCMMLLAVKFWMEK